MDLGDEQPTQHEIGRRTYIVAQVEPLDVGKVREVHPIMWVVAALFVIYFAYTPIRGWLS